jgi:16S rRNA (cytidine1402-2'-O)-methyltransferase
MEAGTLYIVATPIGNLGDITYRAVETLRDVDLIAAEDTRVTRRLLSAYGVSRPLTSYHAHTPAKKQAEIVRKLAAGASVALVTDAGTPGISDPAVRLVRAALEAGVAVVPVPGPTALIAALSASGLPTDRFTFEGFLSTKSGRRTRRLEELAAAGHTVVLYESPRRLAKLLGELVETFGPDRPCVVAREVSKRFEEFIRGTVAEVAEAVSDRQIKGEVTVLVGPPPKKGAG